MTMTPDISNVKTYLDVCVDIIKIPAALLGAYFVYTRWFTPASLGVTLDSILFIAPDGDKTVKTKDILFAIQLRFFNAGEYPESIAEISVFEFTISMNDVPCRCSAYAYLKPLKMAGDDGTAGHTTEPQEFKIEVDELVHSLYLPGGQQSAQNVLFSPDQNQAFDPVAGVVKLELNIQARTAAGKPVRLRAVPLMKFRTIDALEARELRSGKHAWLSWHLQDAKSKYLQGALY